MKKIVFLLIVGILVVSGCIPAQVSPQPVREATATIFLSPEASQVANLTRTPDPVAPLATSTPSLNISSSTQQSCIVITENSTNLQDNKNDVVVIAQDKTSSEIYDKLLSPYLLDLQTRDRKLIDGSSFAVSLDKKKLAYVLQDDDKLVIVNAMGVLENEIPFGDIGIIQWMERGLLVRGYNELVFLNLSTLERDVLNEQFPRIYPKENSTLDPYWYPYLRFDFTMSRLFYPARDQQAQSSYIAFWDVNQNIEIGTFSLGPTILWGTRPEWSEDSSQAILAVIEKSKSGFVRKLVSVSSKGIVKYFWTIPDSVGTLYYSLSPDQAKIAFWSPAPTESYDIKNLSLYVLDIQTGLATDYCIISPEIPPQPIWSPDSTKLVVELRQDLGNSDVVVVDLENKTAIKIAEDAQPVGWMTKEP